jgi:hypothetical protein
MVPWRRRESSQAFLVEMIFFITCSGAQITQRRCRVQSWYIWTPQRKCRWLVGFGALPRPQQWLSGAAIALAMAAIGKVHPEVSVASIPQPRSFEDKITGLKDSYHLYIWGLNFNEVLSPTCTEMAQNSHSVRRSPEVLRWWNVHVAQRELFPDCSSKGWGFGWWCPSLMAWCPKPTWNMRGPV